MQRITAVVSLLVILGFCASTLVAQQTYNPVANSSAVVVVGNARFTVLTSQVFRLEYSEDGFEDRATIWAVNRNLPVPEFTYSEDSSVVIKTDYLVLEYTPNGQNFGVENLQITVFTENTSTIWFPGLNNKGNLLGTLRTLDTINGSIDLNCTSLNISTDFCDFGVASRDGWAIVDETERPVFVPGGDGLLPWIEQRNVTETSQDWYFFGHGRNYRAALKDFTLIGGNIPMPPRFAFGIWWSRYYPYADIELEAVVNSYQQYNVPLDVVVNDMNWHITFYKEAHDGVLDQAGQPIGWTGYTWAKNLFPYPESFTSYLEQRNLKLTLNLHPASGVQPWEQYYPEMATAMGIDPATQKYVPFDITNQTFANNLMDIMLKPREKQGVDFWWIDWQQYENTSIVGMDSTFWLNYVFYSNWERISSDGRPLILSRWGGLGNHRLQVGFSGDVVPSWASLNFQPYFTATAANVGFGYWSHDIGGHTLPSPPELFTRWVQLGIFSPVVRPHCSDDPGNTRALWDYPEENFQIMRDMFYIRRTLIPYIYTAARRSYDEGLSMALPLYYTYPYEDEAYEFPNQFTFGDSFLVAPVTSPMVNATQMASVNFWIPPNEVWIEFTSGAVFIGPDLINRTYTLYEVPAFVRAGAIIPQLPNPLAPLYGGAQLSPETIQLTTWMVGLSGSGSFYDDSGNSTGYQSGEFTWTYFNWTQPTEETIEFSIDPVIGSYPGMPTERFYIVRLVGVWPPDSVSLNGVSLSNSTFYGTSYSPMTWAYDGSTLSLMIYSQFMPTSDSIKIQVTLPFELTPDLYVGLPRKTERLETSKQILQTQLPNYVFPEDYNSLILALETGDRINANTTSAIAEVASFATLYEQAIQEVQQLTTLASNLKTQIVAQLVSA